jgi:hypothetical protein
MPTNSSAYLTRNEGTAIIPSLHTKDTCVHTQAMNEMDFSHSSRKRWSLLRKLGVAQTSCKAIKISPNSIAITLHKTTNIKPKQPDKMKVKADYKEELQLCAEKSIDMKDFGREEMETILRLL